MPKHLSYYGDRAPIIAALADRIERDLPIRDAAPNDLSAAMSVVRARRDIRRKSDRACREVRDLRLALYALGAG